MPIKNSNGTLDLIKKVAIIFLLVSGIIFSTGVAYSSIKENSQNIEQIEKEYSKEFGKNNETHTTILIKLEQIDQRLKTLEKKIDKLTDDKIASK